MPDLLPVRKEPVEKDSDNEYHWAIFPRDPETNKTDERCSSSKIYGTIIRRINQES